MPAAADTAVTTPFAVPSGIRNLAAGTMAKAPAVPPIKDATIPFEVHHLYPFRHGQHASGNYLSAGRRASFRQDLPPCLTSFRIRPAVHYFDCNHKYSVAKNSIWYFIATSSSERHVQRHHQAEPDGKKQNAYIRMLTFRHLRDQFFHDHVQHGPCRER